MQHPIRNYYPEMAGITLPVVQPQANPVWHLYVLRLKNREKIAKRLKMKGIETGVHYPIPLHLQPAYQHLGVAKGTLPVCERAADQVLSLPLYPEMTDQLIETVARELSEGIKEFAD
jgi:dTDP-4-amino-4,6-dideoxygalactose transaminase